MLELRLPFADKTLTTPRVGDGVNKEETRGPFSRKSSGPINAKQHHTLLWTAVIGWHDPKNTCQAPGPGPLPSESTPSLLAITLSALHFTRGGHLHGADSSRGLMSL